MVRPVLVATSLSGPATAQSTLAGPRVPLAGSGKGPPELSLEGIMEPVPFWAWSPLGASRGEPSNHRQRSASKERGGADLH